MTENKRFTCHQMIASYTTGEDIDFDFLQELIDEQEQPLDLRMHISDGNKIITYRECVDLLNVLYEENQELKLFINELANCNGEIILASGVQYRLRKKFKGEWVK